MSPEDIALARRAFAQIGGESIGRHIFLCAMSDKQSCCSREAGELVEGSDSRPEGLTTESAAQSMRESLAALAMIAEPGTPPQIVRSGETSLEGLTRDLLRPMLAEWLDKNLPEMVERLVKAEIARIAGKKG